MTSTDGGDRAKRGQYSALTDNRDEAMDSKSLLVQQASADERRGAIVSWFIRQVKTERKGM